MFQLVDAFFPAGIFEIKVRIVFFKRKNLLTKNGQIFEAVLRIEHQLEFLNFGRYVDVVGLHLSEPITLLSQLFLQIEAFRILSLQGGYLQLEGYLGVEIQIVQLHVDLEQVRHSLLEVGHFAVRLSLLALA
jgi:hypothetical protein